MEQTDTRVLVERACGGERAAFEELVGRYRSHLEAVITRRLGETLRTRVAVEDVLQETLVRAFRSLDRFEWRSGGRERTSSFFRWLCGIAVRVILEEARRKRGNAPITLDFDLAGRDDVSPSGSLARKERRERFDAALARLSPDHRTVLRLVRIEGLPLRDVAERMDRAPNAVSQLLLRALRSLRREFGEMDHTGSLHLDCEERDSADASAGRDHE